MGILVFNKCEDTRVIENNINSLGYNTVSVNDFNQLDKCRLSTIQAIVIKVDDSLDETIRIFRQIYHLSRSIPIILVSEKGLDIESLAKLKNEGMFDWISWPLNIVELKSRIDAARLYFKKICECCLLEEETDFLKKVNNIGETVINLSQNAIIISNNNGKIEWFNPSFKRLSGYDMDDLLGKSIHELKYNHHDPSFYKNLYESIQNECSWQGEVTVIRKDQKLIYEKLIVYPIFNTLGETNHLAWVMPDLTEKKEYEHRFIEQMEMAKHIQRSVLSPPLNEQYIQIDAIYKASEKLAGDMYAWFKIDEHRYGIILLDIMGHGMSAALISMSIRSLLPGMIKRIAEPIKIMEELNKHMWNLFSSNEDCVHTYFTAFYLVIDTNKQTIEYVNAGHPPAMLYENGAVTKLDEGCFAVGAFPKLKITKGHYQYQDELKILLYTDGAIEAMSPSPVTGLRMLEKLLLESYRIPNCQYFSSLETFYKEKAALQDDVCIVSISLQPK